MDDPVGTGTCARILVQGRNQAGLVARTILRVGLNGGLVDEMNE